MTLLFRSTAPGPWLLGFIAFAALGTLLLPSILLLGAFDERRKRPVIALRLARAAMVTAVVAVGVYFTVPWLSISDSVNFRRYLRTAGAIVGVWQATVFCLAWVLSREPRGSRPSTD